ncbi:hypothetical protein [Microbulbifer sp. TRSA005]|uniref:hypothetical protein n=1 Tax=Microbulbifer sp. TRSA005 TaxID=3243383 RepID=UPI00403A1487
MPLSNIGEKMARGDYNTIIKNKIYIESEKEWNIELQQSDMVWYDLVVNSHEIFPLKELFIERFKKLNKQVKDNLEKRFVYFICSRKKVRFSPSKKPRYSITGKKLYLYLEVGRDKKPVKITLPAPKKKSDKPKVEVTDKFITFTDNIGDKYTTPLHDFLLNNQIDIGIETIVHYVGKTKLPEKRPLNGSHTGLNNILHNISNEENDIFIFYNLFKIMVSANNNEFKANFIVPNSMTDEINVEKEGDILEKSLILHFASENQLNNLNKELGELRNNLSQIAKENNINKITMRYEVDDTSEYYKFGSSAITPKHNHTFSFSTINGVLKKENHDSSY